MKPYVVHFPGNTWTMTLSSETEAKQLKLLVEFLSDLGYDLYEIFRKYGTIE